jgi:hypothetical protein
MASLVALARDGIGVVLASGFGVVVALAEGGVGVAVALAECGLGVAVALAEVAEPGLGVVVALVEVGIGVVAVVRGTLGWTETFGCTGAFIE